uniref:Zinc finger BED domain-containing protein 4 n=1 Tax=Meloidogyne enterolobii TaxID=390850 RepID=A0A6V7VT31_MELEN|nr:unnamed protein product [Meloidogyne enterolobii]
MSLNPGNWWFYFNRINKSTAKCKIAECNYIKDTGKSLSIECLKKHLKNKHPNLFQQREDYVAEERKKKEKTFENKEDNPLKRSFAKAQLQESGPSQKCHSPDILETLKATKSGAWDRNGSSFKEANRGLIEMIAAGILPFSLVEQPGFVRFCKIIQPRYNPPGRRHFTQVELQSAYDDMKCVKAGISLFNNDEPELSNLIERAKRFVRKIKKSRVLSEEFKELQAALELPSLSLQKDIEVRWNSTFEMIDRLIKIRRVIDLLCDRNNIPSFSNTDWLSLGSIKKLLQSVYDATKLLQNQTVSISVIIPIYCALQHNLTKEDSDFSSARKKISETLSTKLGRIEDNRDLVLATLLDLRFKLIYLDETRWEEYKKWLIQEAEKNQITNEEVDDFLIPMEEEYSLDSC